MYKDKDSKKIDIYLLKEILKGDRKGNIKKYTMQSPSYLLRN